MRHPAVATVLMGASRPEEVVENARLAEIPIPDALWADLRREKLVSTAAVTPKGVLD
jgi:D-threo-aldose 1-dehydrogenase